MIAILVNSLAGGGAERVALTLLEELRSNRQEVRLVCIEREQSYSPPLGTPIVYLTRFEKLHNPLVKVFWLFISAYRLSRYVREHNIGVVQSHLIRSNFINTAAKIFGAKHQAQIVSHLPVRLGASFPLRQLKRAFYRWLYSKADQIVSISEIMKNGINQALNFTSEQVDHIVLPNPHDIGQIEKLSSEPVTDFVFSPQVKYIVSVGRQLRHKRIEVIIKALSIVRSRNQNVELLIIGEGKDQAFFKEEAINNGMDRYVHFLGHRSNPFSYLSRADLFVLCSEIEGLPNIIIESLICGVPVISSDCISGPREILSPDSDLNQLLQDKIEYARSGVLYPIERADLLATAIMELLSNQKMRDKFIEEGKTYARKYDKEIIAQKYLKKFYPDPSNQVNNGENTNMKSKKRIAFFGLKYYPSQGGSSRIAESIARELRHRYEITIYCYPNSRSQTFMPEVKVVNVPRFPFGSAGVFLYYFCCCTHLFWSKPYDLIHVHKTDSALFIPILRRKAKVIATSQEAPYLRDKWKFFGKAYFRLMEKFFIHSSALLTSVSKPLADYYQRTYGRQVHYVPNGVDITREKEQKEAMEILNRNEIGGPYLMFAARRIMSTKGCHTFLLALKRLNYTGTVLVVGDDKQVPGYTKKLRDLAKGLDVRFVGYVSGKSTLLSLVENSKLFVFPSETEGLSLMLLEVATVGTPIICSDIPENAAVFTSNEARFFADKDSDDLARQLEWALAHSAEMQNLAQEASKKVIHEFSSEVVAKKYDYLYRQLIL
ncbi:MAG: glycosyltransferase [Cyclobacteriaceae bacterium]